MNICYLVGAGEFFIPFEPDAKDLVIGADGGLKHLESHGIRCDLCLGDFDSLEGSPNCKKVITFPTEKDETDMHLAFLEGYERGYRNFHIYGGVGGRCDHTFANYSLLLYGKERGCNVVLHGDGCEIFVIKNEKTTLNMKAGTTLSVFAFGGDCHGVTISGAYYNAKDVTLTQSFPLGVSNVFVGDEVEIDVKDGALLIMTLEEKN